MGVISGMEATPSLPGQKNKTLRAAIATSDSALLENEVYVRAAPPQKKKVKQI